MKTTVRYSIYVCPICGEQIENDYEMGATCYHDGYTVEAITVPVEPQGLAGAMGLARLRIQEERRDRDWRLAAGRLWDALSDDEKRRRLAEMPPEVRGLCNLRENFKRQILAFDRNRLFYEGSSDVPRKEE